MPDAETPENPDTPSTDADSTVDGDTRDDNVKDALQRLKAQREAARKEAAAAKEERDALLKEKTEREAAAAKDREAEAEKKGEFEALAKKREEERDAAKADAAALKAENDQLRAAITAVLDSEWKALPEDVTDAYLGADDDPLARLAFLPKGKALAAKLAERGDPARGNGRDPRAGGTMNAANDEAARRANAFRYG